MESTSFIYQVLLVERVAPAAPVPPAAPALVPPAPPAPVPPVPPEPPEPEAQPQQWPSLTAVTPFGQVMILSQYRHLVAGELEAARFLGEVLSLHHLPFLFFLISLFTLRKTKARS